MLVKGNKYTDERGTLNFVNEFSLQNVKRFYTITHPDTDVVRAWQGHKIETKHFFVTKGSFLFGWVKIDDWQKPSLNLEIQRQVIKQDEPAVLTISAGFANGFKALEKNSTVVVFSNLSLEESAADIFRFEKDTWPLVKI
jgi:dTDP-4-dehydrorhamnose 3,5-epimerase